MSAKKITHHDLFAHQQARLKEEESKRKAKDNGMLFRIGE